LTEVVALDSPPRGISSLYALRACRVRGGASRFARGGRKGRRSTRNASIALGRIDAMICTGLGADRRERQIQRGGDVGGNEMGDVAAERRDLLYER